MSIFGWSYPPGCNGTPHDEPDQPCEVCGNDLDNCICPECPECGDIGNPRCYFGHGLHRTEEQKFILECNVREWEENAKAIALVESETIDWELEG